MMLHVLLLISWNIFGLSYGQVCVQHASGTSIPWTDNNKSKVLPKGAQAIVTSYKFTCCGQITGWQAWVQPGGRMHQNEYDIIFQVWRPSATVDSDRCYSMVGNNTFRNIELKFGGLVDEEVLPPLNSYITVEPGDVVGYRVNSNVRGEEQGIQLNDTSLYNSNDIWYYAEPPVPTDASCPYPVGENRDRSTLINATPKLRVNISSHPCPMSTPSVPRSTTSVPTTRVTNSSPGTQKTVSPSMASTTLTTSSTGNISGRDTLMGNTQDESSNMTTISDLASRANTSQIGVIVGGTLTSVVLLLTLITPCIIMLAVYIKKRGKHKVKFHHNFSVLERSLEPNNAYESSASTFQNTVEQQEMNIMNVNHNQDLTESEVDTNIDAEERVAVDDKRNKKVKVASPPYSGLPVVNSITSFQQQHVQPLEKRTSNANANTNPITSSIEHSTESQSGAALLTKDTHDAIHMNPNTCYDTERNSPNSAYYMSSNVCYEEEKLPTDDVIHVNPNTCCEAEITHTNEISVNSNVCYVPSASSKHKALPSILSMRKFSAASTASITTSATQDRRSFAGESIGASSKYEPVQYPD